MALDTTGTILTLTYESTDELSLLPFYSARGLKQSLEYIDGALNQEETVNAELVDLSVSRFRKLKSVIRANDVRPPSLDLIYPGLRVIVGCAYRLSFPTIGGSPARTPVEGSLFVEGNYTFYRPLLLMMVGKMPGDFDEWEAGHEWSIELREILSSA